MLPYQGKNSLTRSARKTFRSYCCVLLSGDLQSCAGGAFSPPNSTEACNSIYSHACLKKTQPDPVLNLRRVITAQYMDPGEVTLKTRLEDALFSWGRCCPFLPAWVFWTSQTHLEKLVLDLWELWKEEAEYIPPFPYLCYHCCMA